MYPPCITHCLLFHAGKILICAICDITNDIPIDIKIVSGYRLKKHLFLHMEGQHVFMFILYLRLKKYISMFDALKFLVRPYTNTFFLKFSYRIIVVKKGYLSDSFVGKSHMSSER